MHKTLEELESIFLEFPTNNATFLIKKVYEIRRKKLNSYTIEDLRLMIGQNQGLNYLVPIALKVLKSDPFSEGDFYEGDLLTSVLSCTCQFWQSNPEQIEMMNAVIQLAVVKMDDIEITDSIKRSILKLIEEYKFCVSDFSV